MLNEECRMKNDDTKEPQFPPLGGMPAGQGGYQNCFLEQPRRGKTREALITPHKRSAVWGWKKQKVPDCGDIDDDEAQPQCMGLTRTKKPNQI